MSRRTKRRKRERAYQYQQDCLLNEWMKFRWRSLRDLAGKIPEGPEKEQLLNQLGNTPK